MGFRIDLGAGMYDAVFFVDVYFKWVINDIIHLEFDRTDCEKLLKYLKDVTEPGKRYWYAEKR